MSDINDVSMTKMFEDMTLLTMEEWSPITVVDLQKTYGIQLRADAQDLMYADVSNSTLAVRYSWRLGAVLMHDVHVFVFEADGDGPGCLERHYRVRAQESL